MSEFVKVAQVDDLSDPGKVILPVEDRLVVLIRRGQEFYCIDDVCTHVRRRKTRGLRVDVSSAWS